MRENILQFFSSRYAFSHEILGLNKILDLFYIHNDDIRFFYKVYFFRVSDEIAASLKSNEIWCSLLRLSLL